MNRKTIAKEDKFAKILHLKLAFLIHRKLRDQTRDTGFDNL